MSFCFVGRLFPWPNHIFLGSIHICADRITGKSVGEI